MSLLEEALLLQRAAHDLMYLGMDGSPIYSDDLSRRNGEVYRLTTTLYNSGTWGTTVEEQANVCLALLMGYSASFVDHGEKQQHVQEVLLLSRRKGTVKFRSEGCQDLVRFFALLRIKPHAPPLVRVPVNSFEFHSCERTPQVECLMRLRRHRMTLSPDT